MSTTSASNRKMEWLEAKRPALGWLGWVRLKIAGAGPGRKVD